MTGDELNRVLERYGKALSGFCYRLCKNEPDADDLFQNTCLKLLKSNVGYREDTGFSTYLYKTCLNAYRDIYRARKRRNEVFPDGEESKYIESIPDRGDSDEDYEQLYRAINALPYKYKTVIVLSYFRELSQEDISKILGVPTGTVKSRLYKAKNLLKKELEKS